MRLSRPRELVGIAAGTLRFALEASREPGPRESSGLLRGPDTRDLGLDREGTVATGRPDFVGPSDRSEGELS